MLMPDEGAASATWAALPWLTRLSLRTLHKDSQEQTVVELAEL